MEKDIKIFVACHTPIVIPKKSRLCPIQVGAALTDERFPHMIRDNGGKNISEKNKSYCELTAQYYAWKNESAEYYGFCHYRRFLSFEKKGTRPYIQMSEPTGQALSKLGYDRDLSADIEPYNIVTAKGENVFQTVYCQYCSSKHQLKSDIDTVMDIIVQLFPDYTDAMNEYMNSTFHYFCNSFIMDRETFNEYCIFLFGVLAEFDSRTENVEREGAAIRVDGFLGERLFGIFVTRARAEGLKINEVQRVDFLTGRNKLKCRFLYAALPPESKRRRLIKKIKKMI